MSNIINITNVKTQSKIAHKLHNRLGYDKTINGNEKVFRKMNEIRRNSYKQQYIELFGNVD